VNVVLIISDTLRRDHLGCYGNEWIRTPHLDRFAQRAAIFDRAYCASFPTVPNRNDILTGRYTFTYQMWGPLSSDDVTLPELVSPHGVRTSLIADTPHPFVPGFNYQRGFDDWELVRGQEHDPWKTEPREVHFPCAQEKLRNPDHAVVQYLRNVADRQGEEDYFVARTMRAAARWLEENRVHQPFFLYLDTFDPHEPWDPPQHYVDLYDPEYEGEEVIYPRYDTVDFLSKAELHHCRALYAGEVSLVDAWIGYLLERLEVLGLMDSTAVIVTSDHGFYFGEHGYIGKALIREGFQYLPLYPEVAEVPLLIYVPEPSHGQRLDSLAQPVDLFPTILEFLEVGVPGMARGHSLLPPIRGEGDIPRDVAIAAPPLSYGGLRVPHPSTRASIIKGEWLLVWGTCADEQAPSAGGLTTLAVDSLSRRIQALESGSIGPELYRLSEDPGCEHNLMDVHGDVAEELHCRFVHFLEQERVPEEHLRHFRTV
jgi:arylsulfatase A-like enzyme